MRWLLCSRLSTPTLILLFLVAISIVFASLTDAAVRVKDIARIHGETEIDLFGYGLVIGLDGTGDSKGTQFTMLSLANMMQRMGLTVEPDKLKVKNVAAVIVTARLSSNNKVGDRIDATVSSVGDATSLQGGMLLLTPLSSSDGDVYAMAQGPISIGGFNVQVEGGNKIINNYALVGRAPGGANVTRRLEGAPVSGDLTLTLNSPDYTTATRIAKEINNNYGIIASIEDAATIRVKTPEILSTPNGRAGFIADVGSMLVEPDQAARVVINERTGTIVTGANVTIAPAAIAHGNITIKIKATPIISQPEPFSKGETVVEPEYDINVEDEIARVVTLDEAVSLADVARALNQIGAAPRDIIAIFEALKQAGALRAELTII
jgi:flagellar P-ring protein precursor FlgI